MPELSDLQLIQHYVKLRDHVAKATKDFTEATKPYKAGMETIETAIMARLIERGADNTKTEAGTAYKVELINVKVVDRDKFLAYARENDEILLASAQKDCVKQYIADNQAPPPGVEVTYFQNVNVRKS